jgi:hypothetical protein
MTVLHVAIGFHGKPVPVEKIQEAFGTAAGWARYAPNCWLVSTQETSKAIATRVHALCSPHDSILVVKVDVSDTFGWLEGELWEWIRLRR